MLNDIINPFPELRGLMAKYKSITFEQMGTVIGNTSRTFSKKINAKADFTYSDMRKIRDFFNDMGEDLSIDFCSLIEITHRRAGIDHL